MRVRSLIPTAAALALVLLACGSSLSAQGTEDQAVTLTVLIYSGRPNPTATLDDAAAQRLGELLAEAPRVEDYDRDTVLPSILGYNGILVDNPSSRGGLPRRLAVYGGTVEAGEGRSRRFLRDEGGEIESLLIEAAARADALDEEQLGVIREARAGGERAGA